MRLSRFCSHEELQSLLRNGELHNSTDHFRGGKGGSTSVGFCLTEDLPSEAWKYLKGIVTPGTCLIYEIPDKYLQKSTGKYCSHEYDNKGGYCAKTIIKTEWCTNMLKKEWIVSILPLEAFVPMPDLEAARYYHRHKEELRRFYAQSKTEK